jgi:hypothetical protein
MATTKPLTAKPVNIGIPVNILKLLETRALIQAGSGGGKSYIVRKLIESVGNQVQQIILDPEGEFVTLREKYNFALVSKTGGDIPLDLRYAELLAHKILETGISVIIDLYELKHRERIEFVRRFLEALINAPKELWHHVLVYVDEAHIFCPEGTKCESTSAVNDLCTRGRKRGFGAVLATQRLSKLSKDAAAECLNKFIGRTGLDIDQKRAGDELGFTSKKDTLSLRDLNPGDFYAFGPALSNEVTKFRVGKVTTTHPESGKRAVTAPPTPDAIKKILKNLEGLPAEAEKELRTVNEYKNEIARLKREVGTLQKDGKTDNKAIEAALKKQEADLRREYDKKFKEAVTNLSNAVLKYQKAFGDIAKTLSPIKDLTGIDFNVTSVAGLITGNQMVKQIMASQATAPVNKHTTIDIANARKPAVITTPVSREANGTKMGVGEKVILNACAQYPDGADRQQLSVLTGYKRSSRDTYLQRLSQKGFIVVRGNKILATDDGTDALGSDFKPLPTGVELQQYWLKELPQGEKVLLQILIDAHPGSVSRDELTDKSNYLRSSRDTYLQRLSSKKLVTIVDRGLVKASDDLF